MRTPNCDPLVEHRPNTYCVACFVPDDTLPSDEGFNEFYYGQYDSAPEFPHWNETITTRSARTTMRIASRR